MINEQAIVNPAGFWIRLAAQIVDGLILGVVSVPAAILTLTQENIGLNLGTGVICALYVMVLPVFWNGQTVGKKIFGIRIRKMSGEKVGLGTMALRMWVGGLIYSVTLGLAYLASIFMVAFRKDKRSVQDFLAGTYVGYGQ